MNYGVTATATHSAMPSYTLVSPHITLHTRMPGTLTSLCGKQIIRVTNEDMRRWRQLKFCKKCAA